MAEQPSVNFNTLISVKKFKKGVLWASKGPEPSDTCPTAPRVVTSLLIIDSTRQNAFKHHLWMVTQGNVLLLNTTCEW